MGQRGPGAKPTGKAREEGKLRKRLPWRRKSLSRAGRVIAFLEDMKITSGIGAGRRFKLRAWQREIVEALYDTDDTGTRRVREALLSLPRKNGKTQLAAGLALAHLVGPEAEPRGQVVSAAADRDQAALLYREMRAMALEVPELSDRLNFKDFQKQIEDVQTGSVYQALSSDARKAHGLNVSFAVADELAQWRGRELYDNLRTSMGGRAEPLLVTISTQSADPHHVMSEVTSYAREVRDGAVDDPTFYGCIYAAPEDADPFDEATWHACNPALGDFRSLDEFRAEAQRVRRLPAREPSFRLLYLNQAVDTTSRFLNARDWKACMGRVDARDLEGRACYLGLDLASTTDLTACAAWFPETGDALAWFWAPAEGVEERERRDGVPYQQWVREGWLELTPGRALDRHVVARRLAEIVDRFDVRGCAYDRWRAADLRQMLADEDVRLHLVDWGQGFKDMSPALDALETAVLNRELRHGGNPCLTFNVASAVAESDPAGGRKLAKNKSPARIDGAVALAMALGLASTSRKKRRSVYARRGVQTLEIGAS